MSKQAAVLQHMFDQFRQRLAAGFLRQAFDQRKKRRERTAGAGGQGIGFKQILPGFP